MISSVARRKAHLRELSRKYDVPRFIAKNDVSHRMRQSTRYASGLLLAGNFYGCLADVQKLGVDM